MEDFEGSDDLDGCLYAVVGGLTIVLVALLPFAIVGILFSLFNGG